MSLLASTYNNNMSIGYLFYFKFLEQPQKPMTAGRTYRDDVPLSVITTGPIELKFWYAYLY